MYNILGDNEKVIIGDNVDVVDDNVDVVDDDVDVAAVVRVTAAIII